MSNFNLRGETGLPSYRSTSSDSAWRIRRSASAWNLVQHRSSTLSLAPTSQRLLDQRRPFLDQRQQHARRSFRPPPSLLPAPEGSDRHADAARERRLRQTLARRRSAGTTLAHDAGGEKGRKKLARMSLMTEASPVIHKM